MAKIFEFPQQIPPAKKDDKEIKNIKAIKENIIPIDAGLKIQQNKIEKMLEEVNEKIVSLQLKRKVLNQWRIACLENGSEKAVLFYKEEIMKMDDVICDAQDMCLEMKSQMDDHWQQHFSHIMKVDIEHMKEGELENINSELEFIADWIVELGENTLDGFANEKQKKLGELKQRRERLEEEKSELL